MTARRRVRLRDEDFGPCPQCTDYLLDNPHLVGACASVGIEHDISTQQMITNYLTRYHARGHQEQQP